MVVLLANSIATAWVGVGALAGLAVVLALLIRIGRGPAAPVLGGVLAGLLLGPSILGAAFPRQYEAWFVGAVEERRALEIQRDVYEGAALNRAPVPADQDRLGELREDLGRAHDVHARPMRWLVAGFAGLLMIIGSRRIGAIGRSQWLSAGSIGLWSALLPAGLAWLAARFIWDQPVAACSALAAGLAVGPWLLTDGDEKSADEAEVAGARLVSAAGRIASVAAMALVAHAVLLDGHAHLAPLAVVLTGLMLGWILPAHPPVRILEFARLILLSCLSAAIAVRIDLSSSLNAWLILLIAILSGDGRWLGAWLGAMTLGGRSGLRTLRLVLGSMACGPTQLALTAALLHGGLIEIAPASALLAGVLLIELFAPVRRRVAEQIRQAEVELDRIREEDET